MKLKKELKLQYQKITRKKLILKSYLLVPIGVFAALFVMNFIDAVTLLKVRALKNTMSNYENSYFFVQDMGRVGDFLDDNTSYITDEELKQGVSQVTEDAYVKFRETIMGTDTGKYDLVGLQTTDGKHKIVSSGNYSYTNFSEDVNEVVCIKGKSKVGDIVEINGRKLKVIDVVHKDVYLNGTFYNENTNWVSMLGIALDEIGYNLYILHPKNTQLDAYLTQTIYCFNPLDYEQEQIAEMEKYGKIYTFAQLDKGTPKFIAVIGSVLFFMLLVSAYILYLEIAKNAIKRELYILKLYDISYSRFINRLRYNAWLVIFLGALIGVLSRRFKCEAYWLLVALALLTAACFIAGFIAKKYDAVLLKEKMCDKCESTFAELNILENVEFIYMLKDVKNTVDIPRLLRAIPFTNNIYDGPKTLDYYRTCTLIFLREIAISTDEVIYVDDFWKNCSKEEHERAARIVELADSYINKDIKVDWMY